MISKSGNKNGIRLFYIGASVLIIILVLSLSAAPAWATPAQNPLSQSQTITVPPPAGSSSVNIDHAAGGNVTNTGAQANLTIPAGSSGGNVQYITTAITAKEQLPSQIPSGFTFRDFAVKINPFQNAESGETSYSTPATFFFWAPNSFVDNNLGDLRIHASTDGTTWTEKSVTVIVRGTGACATNIQTNIVPDGYKCVSISISGLTLRNWFALTTKNPAPIVVLSAPPPTPVVVVVPTATPAPTATPLPPGVPTPTPAPTPTPVVGKASVNISAATGGTLVSADKKVTATVPGGAIGADVVLAYVPTTTTAAPPLPSNVVFGTAPFNLDLQNTAGQKLSAVLAKTMTISVQVTADILKAAGNRFDKIVIRKYDETRKVWVSLVTKYDPITNTASTDVATLSLFALTIDDPVGPPPITQPTAVPPPTGDFSPSGSSLAATALMGLAMLVSGGYFFIKARKREDSE